MRSILVLSVPVALLSMACAGNQDDAGASDEALTGGGATVTCTTPARAREDASLAPHFTLSATVPKGYRSGAELTTLSEIVAAAGRPGNQATRLPSLAKDASYKPRANKNRIRFALGSMDATDESFDGIVHSVILPKTLGPADVDGASGDDITFHASVASSTDSYHDGIISYFKLACNLFSDGNDADMVRCESREGSSDAEWGAPSFTFSAGVPASFATGGALSTLTNVSASAAQSEPTTWKKVDSDPNYHPRTQQDRLRFNFPMSLDVSDGDFDGIAHGFILPKSITPGAATFKAWVISSTDSYHDGIMTYFPMDCRVAK